MWYDERDYPKTKNCLAKTKGAYLQKIKALITTIKAEIQAERRQLREAGNRP